MPKKRRSILREKWTEALTSVLPITLLVFLICFVLVPVPNNAMMGFIIGAALLVLGMGLFTLGTDLAMTPIGQHVGNTLTRSKKMWVIALVGFISGRADYAVPSRIFRCWPSRCRACPIWC